VLHPLDEELRKASEGNKLRSIPVRLLFDDPTLNLRADYSLFNRENGRPLCRQRRHLSSWPRHGDVALSWSGCVPVCQWGLQSLCPLECGHWGRGGDAMGSFVPTTYNTIRTLAARLHYLSAVSGGRLSCLPLELKLRGKSTTMSYRSAIYVDLVVRSGLTLEQAVAEAVDRHATRAAAGSTKLHWMRRRDRASLTGPSRTWTKTCQLWSRRFIRQASEVAQVQRTKSQGQT
jgi:hypothetical protein